ncbi:hypothetical protein ATANTOWER_031892 [Ataeniobius toweri]|uniref:Uncharacterized protein n=1 Tax=Ataeniobius toweri TaxID=208326 RepID=A0ABU7BCL3_9TELE|nr:hypothetical protein [Ataeniobius toweri]
METSFQTAGARGLWNNPRPPRCSKETQEMLRLRKEESRLICLQRKQINTSAKSSETCTTTHLRMNKTFAPYHGAVLPQTTNPGPSSPLSKSAQPGKSKRRSAESCRAGNSYERETFHPGPIRDLEKEKRRLQNILATGHEEPTIGSPGKTAECCKSDESEETERYQEVLNEIEERRQFLADMAALGQEQQYVNIINAEISQRIRELDILDHAGSPKQRINN